ERGGVPVLAQRPPARLHHGRRPALRAQPAAPVEDHRARRDHREPRGPGARRRALARDAAPGPLRRPRRAHPMTPTSASPAPTVPPNGAPRLSINRWTCRTTPIQEFLEATAANGIESVGLWRQDVEEVGLDALRRRADDAGLRVTSLCRGGFLTVAGGAE